MKKISKIVSLVLTFVLALTLIPSVTAQAATKKVLPTQVIYLRKSVGTSYASFSVDGINVITNLKSNKTVIKPTGYNSNTNIYDSFNINDKNGLNQGSASSSKYVNVNLSATKAGKAKITFSSGTTNYVQPVEIKKYSNPLKSLTITNVKDKNIAKKLKNTASLTGSDAPRVTRGGDIKVTAKANKNWVITGMYMNNSYSGGSNYASRNYFSGVPKGTVGMMGFKVSNAKYCGYVNITLRNTKTNGTINVQVDLYGSSVN